MSLTLRGWERGLMNPPFGAGLFFSLSCHEPWRYKDQEKHGAPPGFTSASRFPLIRRVTESAVVCLLACTIAALSALSNVKVSLPGTPTLPLKWDRCSQAGWMRHDLTRVGDDIDRSSQSLWFVWTRAEAQYICSWRCGVRGLMILWTSQNKHVHLWPDDVVWCVSWPCGWNMQSHDLDSSLSAAASSVLFRMSFPCLHSHAQWNSFGSLLIFPLI